MNLHQLRKSIISGKTDLEDLKRKYGVQLVNSFNHIMDAKVLTQEDFEECQDLIMLLLDYYTYSQTGEVIVSDHDYDLLMNHYLDNGGALISQSDILVGESKWPFVKHEFPGMVGTIGKIYEFSDLMEYYHRMARRRPTVQWIIAPKYDGISSAIHISGDGKILAAVTRNDGVQGQNIAPLISNASNIKKLVKKFKKKMSKDQSVWIKTELVVTTEDFERLNQSQELNGERVYANRRSATSGIVNAPRNLVLGKYLTIIPLATCYLDRHGDPLALVYLPKEYKEVITKDAFDLMDEIEKMLAIIRESTYPIRTDGVVIFPVHCIENINYHDIMDQAIAFKVNTEEALTTIDHAYIDVGILGYAQPKLRVEPVECNETVVTDVSIGSFSKFVGMGLHEHEQVVVYSAGDVIPQVKLPNKRKYKASAKLIKLDMRCPYCGKKLAQYKDMFRCINDKCERVVAGRITNFITKLGAKDVSYNTIRDLVRTGLLEDVWEIFELTPDEIMSIPGYQESKAALIVNEFHDLKTKEISTSRLIGALGIQGIAEKKCRSIFESFDLQTILDSNKTRIMFSLTGVEGIGKLTASIFVDFVFDNKELIQHLIHTMNIVEEHRWKGEVVLTGTRDPHLIEGFNKLGYDIGSSVKRNTVLLVSSNLQTRSTKAREADRKGIPIIGVEEAFKIINDQRTRAYYGL